MQVLTPPIPSRRCTSLMLKMLKLKKTDRLLEIGTGTGTQTQTWQKHAGEVHTIELPKRWKVNDARIGGHVYLHYGDGAKGCPEGAPFDAIVATCGTPSLPQAWMEQVKEGGRIVAPIGTNEVQRLTLYKKKGENLIPQRVAAYVRFVMLEEE